MAGGSKICPFKEILQKGEVTVNKLMKPSDAVEEFLSEP